MLNHNQICLELVAAAYNDVYCAATGAAVNVTWNQGIPIWNIPIF